MHEIQPDHRKFINIRESQPILPYDIAATAEQYLGFLSGQYDGPEIVEESERGVDCSEFVCIVLTKSGIPLPEEIRHTNEFFDSFGFFIQPQARRKGDLIFFSYDGGITPTHMGILLDSNTYIHAPGKNNTIISKETIMQKSIKSKFEDRHYFENPIGYKRVGIKKGRYTIPWEINNNF